MQGPPSAGATYSVSQFSGDIIDHSQILLDRAADFEHEALNQARRYHEVELEDPNAIDVAEKCKEERYKLMKHYRDTFHQLPATKSGEGRQSSIMRDDSSSIDVTSAVEYSDKDRPAKFELDWCFQIMASSTVWLIKGANRLSEAVGRQTQLQVRKYVDDISRTLRQELGLNEVAEEGSNSVSRLLEPEEEIVLERQALQKRKREYEELS